MVVDILNGTVPLKSVRAQIELKEVGKKRTEVTFTMDFVPKMGLIGLMLVPLTKPEFRKKIGRLVDSNRAFVEQSGPPIAA